MCGSCILAALDEATALILIEHFRSLTAQGIAILVTSHDPLILEAAGTVHRLTPSAVVA